MLLTLMLFVRPSVAGELSSLRGRAGLFSEYLPYSTVQYNPKLQLTYSTYYLTILEPWPNGKGASGQCGGRGGGEVFLTFPWFLPFPPRIQLKTKQIN